MRREAQSVSSDRLRPEGSRFPRPEWTGWLILGLAFIAATGLAAVSEKAYLDYLDLVHNLQAEVVAFSLDTKTETPRLSFQVRLVNRSKTYRAVVRGVDYFLYAGDDEYLGYVSIEVAQGAGVPLDPGKTVTIPVSSRMHQIYAERFRDITSRGSPVPFVVKGEVLLGTTLAVKNKTFRSPFERRVEVSANAGVRK